MYRQIIQGFSLVEIDFQIYRFANILAPSTPICYDQSLHPIGVRTLSEIQEKQLLREILGGIIVGRSYMGSICIEGRGGNWHLR